MTNLSKSLENMSVEIRSPNPKIPLLLYPSQEMACKTHLRTQEHYESSMPQFKGKVFTLEEFIPAYMADQKKETFTYYEDWNGFNTPSSAFEPFFAGHFDPLSAEEQALVSFARGLPKPFYLIATHLRHPDAAGVVRHELGHALWTINPDYKRAAESIVERFNPQRLFDHLRKVGYDQEVLIDEAHAQAIKCRPSAKWLIPPKMKTQMLETFLRFFPNNHLVQYTAGLSSKSED